MLYVRSILCKRFVVSDNKMWYSETLQITYKSPTLAFPKRNTYANNLWTVSFAEGELKPVVRSELVVLYNALIQTYNLFCTMRGFVTVLVYDV